MKKLRSKLKKMKWDSGDNHVIEIKQEVKDIFNCDPQWLHIDRPMPAKMWMRLGPIKMREIGKYGLEIKNGDTLEVNQNKNGYRFSGS